MKTALCLILTVMGCRSGLFIGEHHWCTQPVQQLPWLDRKIRAMDHLPAFNQIRWELHQAHCWGNEVFVLHLFRANATYRGFLLYSHHGHLLLTGDRADSIQLRELWGNRVIAVSEDRFTRSSKP